MPQPSESTTTTTTTLKKKRKRRKRREPGPTLITAKSGRKLGEETLLKQKNRRVRRKKSRKRLSKVSKGSKTSIKTSKTTSIANESNTNSAHAIMKYEKSARKNKLDEKATQRDPQRFQARRHIKPKPEVIEDSNIKAAEENKGDVATAEPKDEPQGQMTHAHVKKPKAKQKTRENLGGSLVVSYENQIDTGRKRMETKFFHMTTLTVKMNLADQYGKSEIMNENPHELWKNCEALQIPMNKFNLYIENTIMPDHRLLHDLARRSVQCGHI